MVITLTTDFGYSDPFVGIMKGVIYGINSQATIVDLTHGIFPQDVLAGALILRHSVHYFPPDTIHVAVVDPGVGSLRKPLLIEAGGSVFIGPDNGIWSLALAERTFSRVIHLSNRDYHLKPSARLFTVVTSSRRWPLICPWEYGRCIRSIAAEIYALDLPPIQSNGGKSSARLSTSTASAICLQTRDHDLKDWARDKITIALRDIHIKGVQRITPRLPAARTLRC